MKSLKCRESVCWKTFNFPAQESPAKEEFEPIQGLLVANLVFKRMDLHVLLVHEYLMHMFPCKNYVLEQENELFRKASPAIN
jgi:hypothetical protein